MAAKTASHSQTGTSPITRTLELLDKLVAFQTVSNTSNLGLIDWAQNLLENAGFSVTRIPSQTPDKAGLFARIGPEGGGGICLSGHTDVVPTEGQDWTDKPFELTQKGTRLFGRGTTDMKGFVASALALAERAKDIALTQPLSIVLSYDEEIGCIGIRDMVPEIAPLLGTPRLVIVGEPTSMQIATGHKGKTALEVTCKGQAGHSALAPKFLNAIHVASRFVEEIRLFQKELEIGPMDQDYDVPYSTVHVGTISGGKALNIVPDLVTLTMEYRHLAEVPSENLFEKIRAIAKSVEHSFGNTHPVIVKQTNSYPGLDQAYDQNSMKLAQALSSVDSKIKVAFGTEAGYFAQLGLNTVVIGPGDMASDGHQPDEGLDISQLAACDAMMNRVLEELT